VKIRSVKLKKKREMFEIKTSSRTYGFPFSKSSPLPTCENPIKTARVDKEMNVQNLVTYLTKKIQEFEGACYNPAGLVRHFVTEPVPLYKPKKGGETDPTLAEKVETGLKYLDEFASPEKGGGAGTEEG